MPTVRGAVATVLGSITLATALLGATLAGPAVALAQTAPLPACRYDDILTAPRGYDDWSSILVDTILRVPATYVPPDLVSVSHAGIGGAGQIRAIVIPDLTAMTAAAKANGTPIAVQSAYRSYATQITTFQHWVTTSGYKAALLYSARAGHSEHQLGLAIDFKSAAGGPPWSGSDWGTSPAGAWMLGHAWQYGFIQSYPKGKVRKTCYDDESWHFRYVGIVEAATIHASGLTLREYLWRHHTTAVVPASSSSGTASGTSRPSVPPSAAPSSSPSTPPSHEPSLAPSEPAAAPATPSAPSKHPGSLVPATPRPSDADPPTSPADALLGPDPATALVLGGLAVLVLALAGTIVMARRSGGGRGPKGQSGVGLPG